MTQPLSDREYRSLAEFRYALRTFLRFSEEAAREAGLTPAQHQLLLAIRGHPGAEPPSTSEIADRLQLKLHSTVELVARAEANGLVVRVVDEADARRALLALTEAGESKLAGLSVLHRRELKRFRDEMRDVLHELQ
jgi:DNA-binding MarR family transcriptional regulator